MAITIDGDSGVSGVNGSATTPALQGTDSNTGIVFGTDEVQIATGGSTRATVDSSGDVGIGITSPASKAHVKGGSVTVEHGSPSTGTCQFNVNCENNSQVTLSYDDQGHLAFGTASTPSTQASFSEKVRLDSSGRLLVGTTSAREHLNDGSDSAQVFIQGTTQNTSTLAVIRSSDNDGPSHIVLGKARGTGQGSTTVVQSGDTIGHINFEGADGTHLIRAAQISCVVDGSPSANDMPGRLSFKTCADGGNSLTERLRIGNAGDTTLRVDSYGLGVRSIAGSSSVNTAYFVAHSSTSMSTGNITFEVYTNGNVKNSNNSYGQLSDERLKENIINAPSQWDDIKSLQIRKYNFRDGNGYDTHTQIGLVAQEVEAVSPGLVQETPVREDATPVLDAEGNELEATKSVLTSVLYMKAVKALQEAQTRIETLETQHADLLARVTALEAA